MLQPVLVTVLTIKKSLHHNQKKRFPKEGVAKKRKVSGEQKLFVLK